MGEKHVKQDIIYRSENFFLGLGEFMDTENKNLVEIRSILNKQRYRISETGESYRVINNWDENGLLLDDDERGNGWRNFSMVEILWIHILRELRTLGFSLTKLKTLRNDLFLFPKNNGVIFRTDFLTYFFYQVVLKKKDCLLVVNVNGNGSLCSKNDYEASQLLMPLPASYVLINLNKLIAEILNKPELGNKNEAFLKVDEKELAILYGISVEGVNEVRITTKDNKINKIEMKKNYKNPEDAFKKIRELAKDGQRKRISVEVQDGKIVAIEETKKT